MTDEEKKARAKQLGISVEELDKGIADGTLTFDDKEQGTPSVDKKGNVSVAVNPPAGQVQEESAPPIDPIQQRIDEATANIKDPKLKEAAKIQADTAGNVYRTQTRSLEDLAAEDEEFRRESKARFDRYQAKFDEETEETDKLNRQLREDIVAANKVVEDSNKNILERYIRDAEFARKENEVMGKAERSAALWTGATELASALANLIGVSRGAENQQIKFYSEDWMKRADQNRKDRIKRMDSLKDRMDAISAERARLQSSSAKELAEMDYKINTYKPGRATMLAGKQLEHGDRISALEHESRVRTIQGRAQADIGLSQGLGSAQLTGTGLTGIGKRGGGSSTTTTTTTTTKGGDNEGVVSKRPTGAHKVLINGKPYWHTPAGIKGVLLQNRQLLGLTEEGAAALAEKPVEQQMAALNELIKTNPTIATELINTSLGRAPMVTEEGVERPETAAERLGNI